MKRCPNCLMQRVDRAQRRVARSSMARRGRRDRATPPAAQAPAGIAKPWTHAAHARRQAGPAGQLDQRDADAARAARDNTPLSMTEGPGRQAGDRASRDRVERLAQRAIPNRPAPPKGGDGSTGAAGNVGGYNNFWIDPGDRVAVVNGEYRSSLIVDPPNGKVPAQTPEARKRGAGCGCAAMQGARAVRSPRAAAAGRALPHVVRLERRAADAAELLLQQQLPDRADQGHVMILVEMVHDVRVIRIGADLQHPPTQHPARGWAIRSAAGKATRWWSRPPTSTRCRVFRGASENLKVIERFTRDRRRHNPLQVHDRRSDDVYRTSGAARFPSTAQTS